MRRRRSPRSAIARGDRVGLLLPNCPQFFIAQFGAWKIGAIVAPLNPIYTEHELEGPLREHGIETVRHADALLPARQERAADAPACARVIATNIKDYFPPLLRVLFTLFRETRDGDRIALQPGDHDFAHLLLRQPRPAAGGRAARRRRIRRCLLMSGGTTGTPKGVLGTHGAYVMAGLQIKTWNASALRGADDVTFLPLPMFHVYGNVGVQALAFIDRLRRSALVPNPRDLRRSARRPSAASSRRSSTACRRSTSRMLNHPARAAAARSTSSRSASASPAPRRCSPTPRPASKRSPAPASSRATR